MIDIIIITDREIKRLNKKWFKRVGATDVIAFDGGDVYISIDTAMRQARERGVSVFQELLRLAVHGTAHIAGYNDDTYDNFCAMRRHEWSLLIRSL